MTMIQSKASLVKLSLIAIAIACFAVFLLNRKDDSNGPAQISDASLPELKAVTEEEIQEQFLEPKSVQEEVADTSWRGKVVTANSQGLTEPEYASVKSIEKEFGLPLSESVIQNLSGEDAARLSNALSICMFSLHRLPGEHLNRVNAERCQNLQDRDLYYADEVKKHVEENGEIASLLTTMNGYFFTEDMPIPMSVFEMMSFADRPDLRALGQEILNDQLLILEKLVDQGYTRAYELRAQRLLSFPETENRVDGLASFMVAASTRPEKRQADLMWKHEINPLMEQFLDVEIELAIEQANNQIEAFNQK